MSILARDLSFSMRKYSSRAGSFEYEQKAAQVKSDLHESYQRFRLRLD